jgi:hypothetical protein
MNRGALGAGFEIVAPELGGSPWATPPAKLEGGAAPLDVSVLFGATLAAFVSALGVATASLGPRHPDRLA